MINWLKEKMIPKYKPSKKEQLILEVITNMCQQFDTDILMAPLSGRYYIVNKRLEYWVKVYDDGVTITNHRFTYSNSSPQLFQQNLIKVVETAIEKSRNEFETAVFQNEIELLENIIGNIKNK